MGGFGYGAGTGLSSVDAVRDEALWAEACGFESFWVSQVFGVDPIVALAAISGNQVSGIGKSGISVVPLQADTVGAGGPGLAGHTVAVGEQWLRPQDGRLASDRL